MMKKVFGETREFRTEKINMLRKYIETTKSRLTLVWPTNREDAEEIFNQEQNENEASGN